MAKKQEVVKLPHEYFPPIVFSPSGPDNATQQANGIQARQNPGYTYAMALLAEALSKRADSLMLDYTHWRKERPKVLDELTRIFGGEWGN